MVKDNIDQPFAWPNSLIEVLVGNERKYQHGAPRGHKNGKRAVPHWPIFDWVPQDRSVSLAIGLHRGVIII